MLQIINKISLALFLACTPFLLYGFGIETLQILSKSSLTNYRWQSFLLGSVIFFPCLFLAKRFFYSGWCYLQTLEHELTHLFIGLLFLKIPTGIRVSAHEGGEVRQIGLGTTGQIWVALAPYFFPTISIAVLFFSYFTELNTLFMLGILGWTTVFHLITNWSETSFRQTDLQKAGILKTILILPLMNLICYGSVLSFVAGGGNGFSGFWFDGFSQAFNFTVKIWFYILPK
jgi:hypothetical protein